MIKNINKNLKYKKIIISGANGFTGRFVCRELKSRGILFSVILRPGSCTKWMLKNKIQFYFADLNCIRDLTKILKGNECLINIASIGFVSADKVVESCKNANIKRVIFISSTSIFTKLDSKSKNIRINAEKSIVNSNLNWTIFRPTMIFGSPKDRNMIKLIKWIDNVPFFPVMGQGNNFQQPIYVKDLAWSIVEIIEKKKTFHRIFNLSGPEPLTFKEIIKIISFYLGKKPLMLYLPYVFFSEILKFTEFIGLRFFIKSEQIIRLNEDKIFPHVQAEKIFGYKPTEFKKAIFEEIEIYKSEKNHKNYS